MIGCPASRHKRAPDPVRRRLRRPTALDGRRVRSAAAPDARSSQFEEATRQSRLGQWPQCLDVSPGRLGDTRLLKRFRLAGCPVAGVLKLGHHPTHFEDRVRTAMLNGFVSPQLVLGLRSVSADALSAAAVAADAMNVFNFDAAIGERF